MYAIINSSIAFLNVGTDYLRNREIISQLFDNDADCSDEKITLRLSVIDSFYSTQLNRRLYGFNDLKDGILNITRNDLRLSELALQFSESLQTDSILSLFERNYGINKRTNEFGKAISLISKYLYFLTKSQFPIYDKLAKESYNIISKKNPDLNLGLLSDNFQEYFQVMRDFKIGSNNNFKYGDIDNFLWLFGKINTGSYSLILKKENYVNLVSEMINLNLIGIDLTSRQIDLKIRNYIFENLDMFRPSFDNNLINVIEYVKHQSG